MTGVGLSWRNNAEKCPERERARPRMGFQGWRGSQDTVLGIPKQDQLQILPPPRCPQSPYAWQEGDSTGPRLQRREVPSQRRMGVSEALRGR